MVTENWGVKSKNKKTFFQMEQIYIYFETHHASLNKQKITSRNISYLVS